MSWRNGLFFAAVALALAGWVWMALGVRPWVRPQLGLLAVVFSLLMAGVHYHYRETLTARRITANMALGMVVHTACAALIVAVDRLMIQGFVPTLTQNGLHFLIGFIGIGAAFVSWTKGRSAPDAAKPAVRHQPEPAPPVHAALHQAPDYAALQQAMVERDDRDRLRAVQALQRVEHALDTSTQAARRVIRQEVIRLGAESEAEQRSAGEEDVLSQAASLLEWGAQKLPELAELDVSDILMAKAIADIRANRSRVEKVFVDHRKLKAIHPIDRATADEKCNQRAQAARDALPLLEANGMQLSEDLIAAHDELRAFASVTGFQVIALDDGYVTFEGNGRREALARAFGEEQPVFVEVRLYAFDDPATLEKMQRRVERVRRWKRVED